MCIPIFVVTIPQTEAWDVYIISMILVVVLLLACINYMNLATACFLKRGKEAGLRKVAGATYSDLAVQFLWEAFTVTFLSFILALFISYLILPLFDLISGVPLSVELILNLKFIIKLSFLILLISILAGSYPAYLFSSVHPETALRNDFKLMSLISVKELRKGLVVFQYFISIVLIAGALMIKSQMNFILRKDIGCTPDQVIVVPIYQAGVKPKYETFKKEILNSPDIISASAVNYFPGAPGYNQNVWWDGLEGKDYSNYIDWIPADQDFIKTLKISLVSGEFFQRNMSQNGPRSYVLNEMAAKRFGWKESVGKQLDIICKGVVVGVISNFNFKSLHEEIKPIYGFRSSPTGSDLTGFLLQLQAYLPLQSHCLP
jgi:putative ABC transport system permease protein